MTSEVEICNLALSNIRAGSINSLEESSLPAQVCSLKYDIIRDMMLTEIPWGFAHKIKGLAVLTTEIFNWAYAYQYPVDCFKINRLIGAEEQLLNADADAVSRALDSELLRNIRRQVSYEIFNFDDNKVIGSNESELRIDYIANVTDPNLFSNNFVLAFSHLLAAEIAIPVVGVEKGRQLRSDSLTMYKEYLATAEADDLNEQYYESPLSELETIRR